MVAPRAHGHGLVEPLGSVLSHRMRARSREEICVVSFACAGADMIDGLTIVEYVWCVLCVVSQCTCMVSLGVRLAVSFCVSSHVWRLCIVSIVSSERGSAQLTSVTRLVCGLTNLDCLDGRPRQ